MCVSDVCQEKIHLKYFTLFDSGFLDSLTHLVYLIIVPNGLFVSSIHCQSFTSLSHLYHFLKCSNCSNVSIWSV